MKLTIWALVAILVLISFGCAGVTGDGVQIIPELRDWFAFACETYEDARPVIIALLDAAKENPEIVPEKYRADVEKFRTETGPKLDRGLRLLCAKAEGQPVEQVITAEKSGVNWNAIALNTVKVATVAFQIYAQGRIKADLTQTQTESLAVRMDGLESTWTLVPAERFVSVR